MRWSWRIGKLAGIGIYIHATFVLLPIWVWVSEYLAEHDPVAALRAVGLILVLFGLVVLHEMGHALTARRFGIRTRDITLLPIGGVARLERMPEKPREELLIALAGPAVNVCIALLCFAALGGGRQLASLANVDFTGSSFLMELLVVNAGLALFNMTPAFPMDGGRVLRALLAIKMSYARATRIAARTGQGLAVVFAFFGLFGHPTWVLIAAFVFFGAAQEAAMAQLKSALTGVTVEQLMIRHFRGLQPGDTLSHAVNELLTGWQHAFPVLEGHRITGMLTRTALVRGLKEKGSHGFVGEVMERDFPEAEPNEPIESVLMRLRAGGHEACAVTHEGELLGLLSRQNLAEYLMVHSALFREAELRRMGPMTEREAV